MPILYTARTVDGLVIRADSLTMAVAHLADADGIERTEIATSQDGADLWRVYESHDALDADPDGVYWFAEITVETADYARLFFRA